MKSVADRIMLGGDTIREVVARGVISDAEAGEISVALEKDSIFLYSTFCHTAHPPDHPWSAVGHQPILCYARNSSYNPLPAISAEDLTDGLWKHLELNYLS